MSLGSLMSLCLAGWEGVCFKLIQLIQLIQLILVRLDFRRGCVLVLRLLGRKSAWCAVGMGEKGVIMNGKRAEGTEKDAVCRLFDPPAPYAARGRGVLPWRRYMQKGARGERAPWARAAWAAVGIKKRPAAFIWRDENGRTRTKYYLKKMTVCFYTPVWGDPFLCLASRWSWMEK